MFNMFYPVIVICLGFGIVQGQKGAIDGEYIKISEAPYIIQVANEGVPICSGSIISNDYILTAAQCTYERKPAQLSIRSGTSVLNKGGVVTDISEIFQNPNYNDSTFDYDVAVLKLAKSIKFDKRTQPINLTNAEPQSYEPAFFAGWSTTMEGTAWYPAQLYAVTLNVSDQNACNKTYMGNITKNMMCIDGYSKFHCEGDEGGPVVVNGSQVGIISWGNNCGFGYPRISSNVAVFRQFIDSIMKGNASLAIASKLYFSLSVITFIFSFKRY